MSAARWWVEAQGRAWGPYPAERLAAFRAEGRLGPDSRVATTAEGPFAPAGETSALAGLFRAPAETPAAAVAVEDVRAVPSRNEERGGAGAAADGARTVLVVTDAPEAQLAAFEAALAEHGEALRIRLGLWLLRGGSGAPLLRNALSRRLRGPAMLLVVEAPLASAGWFNLEGGLDRSLRRLWAGS